MIDRAGQRAPTRLSNCGCHVAGHGPLVDGTVRRKACVSTTSCRRRYRLMATRSPCASQLPHRLRSDQAVWRCFVRTDPPIPRPKFDPKDFPRGDGIHTRSGELFLSVMVHGGTLIVIAGTTGSGKTLWDNEFFRRCWTTTRVARSVCLCGGQQRDHLEWLEWGWQTDTGNIITPSPAPRSAAVPSGDHV